MIEVQYPVMICQKMTHLDLEVNCLMREVWLIFQTMMSWRK